MPDISDQQKSCLDVRGISQNAGDRDGHLLSAEDASAFNEGFECAFNGGEELADNPYDHDSSTFCSFNDGFQYWFDHEQELARTRALSCHRALLVALGPDPVMVQLAQMSIEAVAVRIGLPLASWPGRCFEVACRLVDAFNWQERAAPVYGLYVGRISPKCTRFTGASRHGWLLLQDGRIVDPTRWVFDAKDPAIAVFEPGSDEYEQALADYDEGAETLAQLAALPPGGDALASVAVPEELQSLVAQVMAQASGQPVVATARLKPDQLAWLARTPYSRLGAERARTFFGWLQSLGLASLIPVDVARRLARNARWGANSYEALAQ